MCGILFCYITLFTVIRTMKGINLDQLQPVELILQGCLYPHIHTQYSRVCLRLVETMKTQYHLLDYLTAMRVGTSVEVLCSCFMFIMPLLSMKRGHSALHMSVHPSVGSSFLINNLIMP